MGGGAGRGAGEEGRVVDGAFLFCFLLLLFFCCCFFFFFGKRFRRGF